MILFKLYICIYFIYCPYFIIQIAQLQQFTENQNSFNDYILRGLYSHVMAEDSDNTLSLEPLKMLELFPVRKIKCLDFDLQKYKKLYQALSCVFCKQIFNNPTYLRCSHRFCKDCIEKHIRLNQKRSCPICRGQLVTKRDSKYDLKLISLITFAFGDTNSFQQQINSIQEEAVKNINFVKIKSAKQIKQSQKQSKQTKQQKRQRQQSQDKKLKQFQTLPRKKSRRNANQEQSSQKVQQKKLEKQDQKKYKYELSQNKRINLRQKETDQIQKQEVIPQNKIKQKLPPTTTQTISHPIIITTIQPSWKNTKNKQKKKKPQVILIESEGSNQIEITKQSNNKLSQIRQKEQITSLNKLQQKQSKQVQRQSEFSLNKQSIILANNSKQIQCQKKKVQKQIKQRKQIKFFDENEFGHQTLDNRNILKQNLKQDFLRTLILNSNTLCSISIKISRKPKSFLTPNLPFKQLKLSLNIKMKQIKSFILNKFNNVKNALNDNDQMLSLFVFCQQKKCYIICGQNMTVLDAIHGYWKNYDGLSMCEPKEMLKNCLPIQTKQSSSNKQNISKRLLYYELVTDSTYKNNLP